MNLNLRELQVLRSVLAEGSVTAASRHLRISQPAVSKMLKSAENRLGFQLFRRHRQRLYPTPEATALLPGIVAALSALEDVTKHADNLRDGRAGQLTIATSPAVASQFMPRLIRRFRDRWPEVAVVLRTHMTHETVDLIAEQRVDFGVIVGASDDPRTEMQVMRRDRVGCLVLPNHPLAMRETLSLADLVDHPIISLGSNQPVGETLRRIMQEAGGSIEVAIEAWQSNSVCELVAAGVGIGILDGLGLKVGEEIGLVSRPLMPEAYLETSVVLARHRMHSRMTLDCLDMLAEINADIPS